MTDTTNESAKRVYDLSERVNLLQIGEDPDAVSSLIENQGPSKAQLQAVRQAREALKHCPCDLYERLSGHKTDCPAPEAMEALDQAFPEIKEGEKK